MNSESKWGACSGRLMEMTSQEDYVWWEQEVRLVLLWSEVQGDTAAVGKQPGCAERKPAWATDEDRI